MTTFLIEEEGARLDALLAKRFPEHSRTYFQQLIEQDLVFVNGKAPKKKDLLRIGDTVSLTFQERPLPDVLPEDIPLSILYEDDYLIAINKPRGMVVHPGAGNPSGTLVNALLHYLTLPNTSSVRPGIVHRLDKETSGIMIAAKTEQSHARLVDLFKHRSMHKEYLAISLHTPREGIVSMPIGRHPVKRTEMCVCPTGKEAITEISVLAKSKEGCLIRALPKTGRTHQIRVHLKALNAPICGDPIYGDGDGPMLLHAHKLSFIHPFTHQPIQFTASIPKEFCRKKPSLCSIVGAP